MPRLSGTAPHSGAIGGAVAVAFVNTSWRICSEMQPTGMQDVFASQNCTYGFDATTVKQQLKDAWGVDVWLTCNAE